MPLCGRVLPVTSLFLRAPPFPGSSAVISSAIRVGDDPAAGPASEAAASAPAALDLFATIRDARVGGAFWAPPAGLAAPPAVVLRPRATGELSGLLAGLPESARGTALWAPAEGTPRRLTRAIRRLVDRVGGDWRGAVDPWSVLPGSGGLVAHGDDEWVAVARIAGVPVRLLSPGRFGAPGDAEAVLDGHVGRALTAARYRDPFTGADCTPGEAVAVLAEWRRTIDANRPIAVAGGMAWWKRAEIRTFLWNGKQPAMVRSPRRALALAQRAGGALAIWPSRVSPWLLNEARRRQVPIVRVEDGFVRSVGLGSNLVPPSSIVVDHSGIHFDPAGPSDLETILAQTRFAPALTERARALRQTIVAAGISKYGAGTAIPAPARASSRKVVLVAGQVEDDMSVLAGGGGLRSNLEVLRRARALEPDAEVWFRPHPDVDAGHRKGRIADGEALALADRIVRGPPMPALLDAADAVHVLTSLTGFEALMRGREVVCHGTPFYAGWGLTRDLGFVPDRRGRPLTLDELVAGVLILYPRYLDPVTRLPCPPEVLVGRMAADGAPNRLGWIGPLRRWQGRFMAAWR